MEQHLIYANQAYGTSRNKTWVVVVVVVVL